MAAPSADGFGWGFETALYEAAKDVDRFEYAEYALADFSAGDATAGDVDAFVGATHALSDILGPPVVSFAALVAGDCADWDPSVEGGVLLLRTGAAKALFE